jgi:hypothetical protein
LAEAARVNNSRHNVGGAWAHYFFKYHQPSAGVIFIPRRVSDD